MPDCPEDPAVREDDLAAMQRLSIFGALTRRTIAFLLARCEEVVVPAGNNFFEQDAMGDSLFVLRLGRVAVVRTRGEDCLVLAELAPGDFFGEMALLAICPRSATVRAIDECVALRLRNLSILELYGHDPEQFTLLQMNLGRDVARRLAMADETLFDYARRLGETTPGGALLTRAAATLK